MESEDEPRTELCEVCRQQIPENIYPLHERGLDGARPECPKQDLVEIAMRWRGDWDRMRVDYGESRVFPLSWWP